MPDGELSILSGLSAELRGLAAQFARHEQVVGKIQQGHDEIIARLSSIESILKMTGSPVDAAVRMAGLEGDTRGLRAMFNMMVAAFGVFVAAVSALIAGIIQAIGAWPGKGSGG